MMYKRDKKIKENPMKKVIIILWILFIGTYMINETYSRYSSSGVATAEIEVAEWAVSVTDSTNELQNNFILTFTVDENLNVVEDKIAPSTSASAQLVLDLTGTEVAVDYIATISQANIIQLFGTSADKVTLNTSISGAGSGTSGTIALPDGNTFNSSNGKVVVDLALTWENDENYNFSDTAVGITAGTLQIPVTFTVKQHIDNN